jgi:hypothetical protein
VYSKRIQNSEIYKNVVKNADKCKIKSIIVLKILTRLKTLCRFSVMHSVVGNVAFGYNLWQE